MPKRSSFPSDDLEVLDSFNLTCFYCEPYVPENLFILLVWIYGLFILTLGLFGNISTIVILNLSKEPSFKDSLLWWCAQLEALFDIFGLSTGILFFNTIHFLLVDQVWFFGRLCGPILAAVSTCLNYSTWLTVIMTADKLRVLVDPFNKLSFRIWHGKVLSLAVFVVVAVVSSGTMAASISRVTTVEVGGEVIEGYECFSDYGRLSPSMGVVVILSEILPGAFLPFVTLLALNSITYWRYKKQNQKLNQSVRARREVREQRMFRMLRTLAIVFLVCYTPFMSVQILFYFGEHIIPDRSYWQIMVYAASASFAIRLTKNAVGFYVYLTTNDLFRQEAIKIVTRAIGRRAASVRRDS